MKTKSISGKQEYYREWIMSCIKMQPLVSLLCRISIIFSCPFVPCFKPYCFFLHGYLSEANYLLKRSSHSTPLILFSMPLLMKLLIHKFFLQITTREASVEREVLIISGKVGSTSHSQNHYYSTLLGFHLHQKGAKKLNVGMGKMRIALYQLTYSAVLLLYFHYKDAYTALRLELHIFSLCCVSTT